MLHETVSPCLATDGVKRFPASTGPRGADGKALNLETRLLIIEDEMMIAWMLESILTDAGFADIVVAADADEAARAAEEFPPGMVVSDINLGAGANGIQAAITICGTRGIPVLFVTAYADDETRNRIASHFPGAELLRKPVNAAALLDAVQRALLSERRH